MKRLLFIALAIMAIACTKEEAPYLNFDETQMSTIEISPSGATETINFTANNSWTASSSEAWLTINPINGNAGEQSVKITASTNENDDLRSAVVTIQSQGLSQSFNVTQEGIVFILEDTYFGISSDGGTIEIPVKSNVEYYAEVLNNPDWLTIVQSKSSEESYITINVSESQAFEDREAGIKVICANNEEVITISQERKYYIDSDFAKALEREGYISDSNNISLEDLQKITEVRIQNYELYSLQGIEFMESLEILDCSHNQLNSLDLSQNAKLKHIYCQKNQLSSLDISENEALLRLDCSYSWLQSLDVSKSIALEYLDCSGNRLESLDVSKCTKLKQLHCYGNQLASLTVGQKTELKEFLCNANQLTSLDISKCTSLERLICDNNQLTSLETKNCTKLKGLLCNYNQLKTLNISDNVALEEFWCFGNPGDKALFIVEAWFDNNSIPFGAFTQGYWDYDYTTITIDYRKVTE